MAYENNHDKPSNHWAPRYKNKALSLVGKHSKFNFSKKRKIYQKLFNYMDLSWKDFLPFFIGWMHSLYSLSVAYGTIRSSSIFNKKLYRYFRNKFAWSLLIHVINGPVLCFLIIFFSPLINIKASDFFDAWSGIGKLPIYEALNNIINVIVIPYFSSSSWWITFLLLSFLSILNFSAIASFVLINWKQDKYIKLILLEDDLKMKLSNFIKQKK